MAIRQQRSWGLIGAGAVLAWVLAEPALAHHGLGGRLPTTGWEGLISGLAHPVIGLDHLAFVVGVGLLATLVARPWAVLLILGFGVSAALGTGIHLGGYDFPGSELLVTASVLLAGLVLAWETHGRPTLLLALVLLAGVGHGYAYGESIIGAEPAPLGAYLAGFTLIQLALSLGVYRVFEVLGRPGWRRNLGWLLVGAGLVFVSGVLGA